MAAPAVRTLSRYLLRQHVAPLGFALAALTALMLVNTMAKQLSALLGKGLPTGVIVEVFVLSIPFIVAVTLPMAVLVAVLHVFTRLAADNEITAMQASGVSVTRLVAPVLGGAACVALLSFAWNDQVLPRSNHQLRILQVDIQRKKPSFTLKEQVINEVVAGQFFLRAARIDATANKLKDVTIYNLADPERRRVITADSGLMAYTPGGRDLYLTLQDGDIREVNRSDPTQFNRTFFITNRMRVAGVGNSLERTTNDAYKSDREMTICEMRQAAADARREAGNAALEGRRVIENDLRRLAGLAPRTLSPGMFATDTAPPGLYCRLLRRLAAWLPPPPAPAASGPAAASGTAAAPLHAAPAPAPAPNGGADCPVDASPRLHHCGRRRGRGAAPRGRPAAGSDVRGGDPEEVRHRRGVPHLCPGRRAGGPAVPARRCGARDRDERRRVHRLLHRVDRWGGARRPLDPVPVLRDVDPQRHLRGGGPRGVVAHPQARQRAARR